MRKRCVGDGVLVPLRGGVVFAGALWLAAGCVLPDVKLEYDSGSGGPPAGSTGISARMNAVGDGGADGARATAGGSGGSVAVSGGGSGGASAFAGGTGGFAAGGGGSGDGVGSPTPAGGTSALDTTQESGISVDHVFANWPMPDALAGSRVMPSYSTTANTVTDNVTHLVWQRNDPAMYDGCDATYRSSGGMMRIGCTLEQAKTYCESSAVAAALGGTGWRVPTKIELESIVDETRNNPAIDTSAFPNTLSDGFWTSLQNLGEPGYYVWAVFFGDGDSGREDPNFGARVRCVRSRPGGS